MRVVTLDINCKILLLGSFLYHHIAHKPSKHETHLPPAVYHIVYITVDLKAHLNVFLFLLNTGVYDSHYYYIPTM